MYGGTYSFMPFKEQGGLRLEMYISILFFFLNDIRVKVYFKVLFNKLTQLAMISIRVRNFKCREKCETNYSPSKHYFF